MQIGLGIQRRLGGSGGLRLPNSDELILYTKPTTDSIGTSTRTIQPLQYMTGGTITLPDGITIVSNEGTGSVAGDGAITGTVWDLTDSDGNFYPFGTGNILWNVTTGENLVTSGVTCGTDIEDGSDWLNYYGWTLADGTQYKDSAGQTAITNDVPIPALADGSGCCSWTREDE